MEEVVKLFKEGKSFREIERITGINRKRASKYVQSLGYEVIKRGTTGSTRKYALNEEIFDIIDSEEKAYWLGFMFADASIDTNSWVLEFTQKDKEYVESFREFIQSDIPVKPKTVYFGGKTYVSYRISICSKKLCQSLINKGCTPKKSLNKKFPDIEERLYLPFIVGYFDGNGSISKRKPTGTYYGLISTGSLSFVESLKKITGTSYQKKRNSSGYSLYIKVSFLPLLKKWSRKVKSICPLDE